MTAPVETAYAALAARVAAALVAAGLLAAPGDLQIDPESRIEPAGDETEFVTAAALVKVRTAPVRQMLGRPANAPRYVVERECRVELALVGPEKAQRDTIAAAVLTALAALPGLHPTLDGAAERLLLTEQGDDELPPNGLTLSITYTLRLRSSDPLGRTA